MGTSRASRYAQAVDSGDLNPPIVLDRDLACVRCGYQLRGCQVTGRCPECGVAVAYSLGDRRLAFSEPGYVKTLARAMTFQLLLAAAWVVALFGLVALPDAAVIVPVILNCLGLASVWMLTVPDARPRETSADSTVRQLLRLCWGLGAGGSVAVMIAGLDGSLWLVGLGKFAQLAWQPAFFLLLSRYRDLAQRTLRPDLAQMTSIIMVVVPGGAVAWLLLGTVAMAISPAGEGVAGGFGIVIAVVISLVMAAAAVLMVVVAALLRRALWDAHGTAAHLFARTAPVSSPPPA
jgi:hypothetical protein